MHPERKNLGDRLVAFLLYQSDFSSDQQTHRPQSTDSDHQHKRNNKTLYRGHPQKLSTSIAARFSLYRLFRFNRFFLKKISIIFFIKGR